MRPGYFEPGTAISFCAADCAEIGGGCCAKTAPPRRSLPQLPPQPLVLNCMRRPRVVSVF